MFNTAKWVANAPEHETKNFVNTWLVTMWTAVVVGIGFLFSLDVLPFIWGVVVNVRLLESIRLGTYPHGRVDILDPGGVVLPRPRPDTR